MVDFFSRPYLSMYYIKRKSTYGGFTMRTKIMVRACMCYIMKHVWLCILAVVSASAPVISLDSVKYVFVSEAEVDMSRCSTVRWTDTTVSSYNGMSIWNLNPEGLYLLFRQFATKINCSTKFKGAMPRFL